MFIIIIIIIIIIITITIIIIIIMWIIQGVFIVNVSVRSERSSDQSPPSNRIAYVFILVSKLQSHNKNVIFPNKGLNMHETCINISLLPTL